MRYLVTNQDRLLEWNHSIFEQMDFNVLLTVCSCLPFVPIFRSFDLRINFCWLIHSISFWMLSFCCRKLQYIQPHSRISFLVKPIEQWLCVKFYTSKFFMNLTNVRTIQTQMAGFSHFNRFHRGIFRQNMVVALFFSLSLSPSRI